MLSLAVLLNFNKSFMIPGKPSKMYGLSYQRESHSIVLEDGGEPRHLNGKKTAVANTS